MMSLRVEQVKGTRRGPRRREVGVYEDRSRSICIQIERSMTDFASNTTVEGPCVSVKQGRSSDFDRTCSMVKSPRSNGGNSSSQMLSPWPLTRQTSTTSVQMTTCTFWRPESQVFRSEQSCNSPTCTMWRPLMPTSKQCWPVRN